MAWIAPLGTLAQVTSFYFAQLVNQFPTWAGPVNANLNSLSGLGNLEQIAGVAATLSQLSLGFGRITCVNGLNSNVNVTGYSIVNITGPSSAYSIGGFTNGSDGRILIVINSSTSTLSIVQADASSAVANRIAYNTTSATVIATCTCMFVYDGQAALWRLIHVTGA